MAAFDPNIRPALWAGQEDMHAGLHAAAGQADVVLPSFDDEAAAFSDATPEATAQRYLAQGAGRARY